MKKVLAMVAFVMLSVIVYAFNDKSDANQGKKEVTGNGEVVVMDKEMFLKDVFDYEKSKEWNYKGNKPAIIDLYADWCGPCKMLAPVIEQLADQYDGKAKIAKLKEVPVIIKEYSPQEVMEIALIENIQRRDLNPIEEALAYKSLIDEYNLKQEEVADRVSKSRTAVTNSMRLLKLAEQVQTMLINEELSMGHARALLSIEKEEVQVETAKAIVERKLSVRETEKLVKAILNPKQAKLPIPSTNDVVYEKLSDKLKEIMGTKVNINHKKGGKGKIEIEYYSQDELERLLELFDSIQNQ